MIHPEIARPGAVVRVTCPDCGGIGGGYCDRPTSRDNPPETWECRTCDGVGTIETEDEDTTPEEGTPCCAK